MQKVFLPLVLLAFAIGGLYFFYKANISDFSFLSSKEVSSQAKTEPKSEIQLQKGKVETDVSQDLQCEIEYITANQKKINEDDTKDLIKVLTKEQIIKQGGISEKDVIAITDSVKVRFKEICQEQILALSIVFKKKAEKEPETQKIIAPPSEVIEKKTSDSLQTNQNKRFETSLVIL